MRQKQNYGNIIISYLKYLFHVNIILSMAWLPHSFSSHNTSQSNHISDPGEVLHAPLWQHQTKHEEVVMVISDDFIQKEMQVLQTFCV